MADAFNTIDNTEVYPGIISTVASFAVCLTGVLFPHLRCLRYIELVFYVSINDLIASIAISLGKTRDGSFDCWFQGLATNYNYLSAIMWSTVITYQVWLIVCKKDVIKDLTKAHILCWGLPLVVTLLPLSTNTYANDDADAGWCFIADRRGSPSWALLFWFIVAYYLWVWISMLFNIFFVSAIVYKLYRMQEIPQRVNSTIRKLLLYPIVISLCWGPVTVWDIYNQVNDVKYTPGWTIFDGAATVSAISQGFLFTIVFFGFNTTVRTAWKDLFVSMGCVACTAAQEPAQAHDDKSVSMVSVSMGGSSSVIDDQSLPSDASSGIHRTTRRTSGFLGGGGGGGVSWYARPQSIAQLQEEDDFIPMGDARLSQRLSILDFLAGDAVAVRTASAANGGISQRRSFFANLSMSFSQGKSRQSNMGDGLEGGEHGENPMVSVEINDFASVRSGLESAGTGTATASVRRAAADGGSDSDEESGITSATGTAVGAEGRRASQSSVGTVSTGGTFGTHGTAQTGQSKQSAGNKRLSVGFK